MNRTPTAVLAYFRNLWHLNGLEKQYLHMLLKTFVSFCCLAMIFLGMAWSSYSTFGTVLSPWTGDLLQTRPNVYAAGNPNIRAMKTYTIHHDRPDLVLREYKPSFQTFPRQTSRSWSSHSGVSRNDMGVLPNDGAGYMLYAPFNGFSSQARELANALKIAFLLNRTLVIPPVLDHFELEHGTCLNPLHSPADLRKRSWEAIISRFDTSDPLVRPYLSIADVIDLSSVKSMVKTIDLRVFLMLLCGMDVSATCSGPVCLEMLRKYVHVPSDSPGKDFRTCESKLFPKTTFVDINKSRFRLGDNEHGAEDTSLRNPSLVYEVDEDCRSVVWTHDEPHDWTPALQRILMDSVLADEAVSESISTSYGDPLPLNIIRKDLRRTLGTPSLASRSPILSFGSLFSRPYRSEALSTSWPYVHDIQLMVDIHSSRGDEDLKKALEAIQYQPFSKHVQNAAVEFIEEKIKANFFCAHVRLEDGAFVSNTTQMKNIFLPLQEKLDHLTSRMQDLDESQNRQLNVFLMTDQKRRDWNSSRPMEDFTMNPLYKIHTLDGMKTVLRTAARAMLTSEDGLALRFVPLHLRSFKSKTAPLLDHFASKIDIRLFVEEVVCSCATLGFQGTMGSTITKNIRDLRKAKTCPLLNPDFPIESNF